MRRSIVPEKTPLTFADYFKLTADAEELVGHFGYSLAVRPCELPGRVLDTEDVRALKRRLEEYIPYVSLTTETARREFLIAPVLFQAVEHTHARLRVEYPLEVDDQLKGTVDYFLEAPKGEMLVVEAKQGDLQRGFNQLAVELIALDRWTAGEDGPETLWGAVSLGDVWRFGFLERQDKRLTQDLNHFGVPEDLERLLGILVAVLLGSEELS